MTEPTEPRPAPRAHGYTVGGLPSDPTPEQSALIHSGEWQLLQPDGTTKTINQILAANETQDAANYLLQRRKDGREPRERTIRLNAAAGDPLNLLRDIRLDVSIDVSIDGNNVGARMVHEPTGATVEAPGLGVALVNALRACVAAVNEEPGLGRASGQRNA